jgi:hypothetical protein
MACVLDYKAQVTLLGEEKSFLDILYFGVLGKLDWIWFNYDVPS